MLSLCYTYFQKNVEHRFLVIRHQHHTHSQHLDIRHQHHTHSHYLDIRPTSTHIHQHHTHIHVSAYY